MTAFPQLARCARHQLKEDAEMLLAIHQYRPDASLDRPNLLIDTGGGCTAECLPDCDAHRGLHLPVLSLREG